MKKSLEKPFVICHMLSALDGKITSPFMSAPETAPMRQKFGEIRSYYQCDATIYGTVTMAESYACGYLPEKTEASAPAAVCQDYAAPSDVHNYIVSLDCEGRLKWEGNYLEKKGRPRAHVIEILTERVSADYVDYLRSFDISYIFVGKDAFDPALALSKLKTLFGIQKLMVSGGGYLNWTFLRENLVDELSLVLAPVADGETESVTVFERMPQLPARNPVSFHLLETEIFAENGLWLRYRPEQIG